MRKFFKFLRSIFSRKNKKSKAKKQKSEPQHKTIEAQIEEPVDSGIPQLAEDQVLNTPKSFKEEKVKVFNKSPNICKSPKNDKANISQIKTQSNNELNEDFDLDAITRTSILPININKSKRDIRPPNLRPPNRQDRNSFISDDDSVTNLPIDIPQITVHDDGRVNSNSKEEPLRIPNKMQILDNELSKIKLSLKDLTAADFQVSPIENNNIYNNLTVNQFLRNRKSERQNPTLINDLNIESRKSLNFDDTTAKINRDISDNKVNNQLKLDNKKNKISNTKSLYVPKTETIVSKKLPSNIITSDEVKKENVKYNYKRRESKDDLMLGIRPSLIQNKLSSKSSENINEIGEFNNKTDKRVINKAPPKTPSEKLSPVHPYKPFPETPKNILNKNDRPTSHIVASSNNTKMNKLNFLASNMDTDTANNQIIKEHLVAEKKENEPTSELQKKLVIMTNNLPNTTGASNLLNSSIDMHQTNTPFKISRPQINSDNPQSIVEKPKPTKPAVLLLNKNIEADCPTQESIKFPVKEPVKLSDTKMNSPNAKISLLEMNTSFSKKKKVPTATLR